jgi:hypothetical protein
MNRLLFLFACIALLAISQVYSQDSQKTNADPIHDYVGAQQCASCHQKEYQIWLKGPHARAFDRLTPVQKKQAKCISCHTMTRNTTAAMYSGVQCESCHGAGRLYAKDHIMKDKVLRAALNLQEQNEQICLACHTTDSPQIAPFDYVKMKEQIRHW